MNTTGVSRPNLGQRLRELRAQNRWRIADVSRMTGLAASTISKVENNRMSLTYDKLQQLAHGLSLDLADLLGDRRGGSGALSPTASSRRSVGRAGDGAVVMAGFYEYRYLNADLAPKQMVPIIGVVTGRSLDEFGELIRHEGEEFVFVLEGSLVVHSEFYAPLILRPGDHVYIDSRMGHAYLAGEGGTCRMLVVCSSASAEEIQKAIHSHPTPTPESMRTALTPAVPRNDRSGKAERRTPRRTPKSRG
jgi:transcriptional regulator with XRE-family HTH domain